MMNYQEIYNNEINTFDKTWKVFTEEEIVSLKNDAKKENNLYFLAIDYNCIIAVVKYILTLK